MKSPLALVFVLLTTSTIAKNCTISGLPGKTNPDASVTIIRVNNVTSLSLSCRCSFRSPMWTIMHLEDWQIEEVTGEIGCEDNGGPCDPPERSFISEQSDGVFTFIDHTFTINQSTVLKCHKITNTPDSPDETAIIYFHRDEEETEAPTVATSELLTTSATTELPSATSTSLYIPSTITDEPATGVPSTTQRQPVTTPNEPPTDLSGTMQRVTDDDSSTTQSMPSEMTFINTIENELGQSALYLFPVVLALVVIVVVLFGCLILLKYKRKKVPEDVEKSATEQKRDSEETKQEIELPSNLQESILKSNSNTYVTFTLSPPTQQQHTILEAVPNSYNSLTNLKQVEVDGSSNTQLCNSELALTIPLTLCMPGGSQVLRTKESSPSLENRTITSDSTPL